MKPNPLRRIGLPILVALFLVACGGGGGGGDDEVLNQAPQPVFVLSPNPVQMGEQVIFDAAASSDADGSIASYRWQFGDGSSGQGPQAAHRYEQAGEVTVTLTVSDNLGAQSTTSKVLTVLSAFGISGEIQVGGNIQTDSDVNDPAAPFSSNDSYPQAQSLPNPAFVKGFVSSEGSSVAGDRFAASGDRTDIYLVSLLAGQHISLQLADFDESDPFARDIDVFLFDTDNNFLAGSDGFEEFESLVVPTSGNAYIVVESDAGLNRYVLRISNDFSAGRIANSAISADFIPNQLIVHYSNSQLAPATQQALGGGVTGLASNREPARPQLLRFGNQQKSQAALAHIKPQLFDDSAGTGSSIGNSAADTPSYRENEKYTTLKLAKALAQQNDVALAEPNYRIEPARVPDDTFYPLQWHYSMLNLPTAWDSSIGESASGQVVVAVIDSGVLLTHPDLQGQFIDGYDFIADPNVADDGDGIDPNPDDVGDQEGPSSSFHGTHVAGTIAAATNNSQGVAAVSWGAKVMPIRVLGIGGGTGYDLIQGLRYAAGLSNDSGTTPVTRADVINLSLGCSSCFNLSMQNTISEARAAGVIIIAASGNHNNAIPFYPAAYDGVVAVSAVNSGFSRAYYSNFGSYIDLTAPGGDNVDRNGDAYPDRILSTLGDDSSGVIDFTHGWSSGTSMAAPHVAGIAALMKAIYPDLSPTQFDVLISNGDIVTDIGPPGRDDDYGHGLVDALKAVQAASTLSGNPLLSTVNAQPNVLDFAEGLTIKQLELSPQGDAPPAVTSVTASEDWLEVSAGINVDTDGYGVYIAQVDRSGLATIIHRAAINVLLDNGDELEIPVYLQVLEEGAGVGDPGLVYVLLRDTRSKQVTHQVEVRRDEEGRFRYRFERSIPPGTYNIFAGSDIDNNRHICGTGETCGAWPTRNDVQEISVQGDLTGIDFELVTDADFMVAEERVPSSEESDAPLPAPAAR